MTKCECRTAHARRARHRSSFAAEGGSSDTCVWASLPLGSDRLRPACGRSDAGDTLVEILISVVVTGLTVGALLLSLASAGTAGNLQRSLVQADLVLRNFADAAKIAAQTCAQGDILNPAFVEPLGFKATISLPSPTPPCPSTTATTVLTLLVSGPNGVHETMQIAVRRR